MQESHLAHDVRQVMKSREIINRRIVRIFKSKMGSSEKIDYLIAKQPPNTPSICSVQTPQHKSASYASEQQQTKEEIHLEMDNQDRQQINLKLMKSQNRRSE